MMKSKQVFLFLSLLALLPAGLQAQSDDLGVWASAEVKKRITTGLDASVEGEFRTRDGLSQVERWAATAQLSYRIVSFLKADVGYTYIYAHPESTTTKKGNIVAAYWSPRHRLSVSLTGSYKYKRLEFSLRERYQLTHRVATSAAKYDGDDGSAKADEEIASKTKHVLRSRLQVEWDIKKSKFSPYVSCELFHAMSDDWSLDKTRWTVGTAYKINKKHSLDVCYRYQNKSDDDEANGHVIGVGYRYKF